MGWLDDIVKDVVKPVGEVAVRSAAAVGTGGLSEAARAKRLRDIANQEKMQQDADAPGIEMARRNALPLMQDDAAIEAAKKRALVNQQKRSGRDSTILSVGLGR